MGLRIGDVELETNLLLAPIAGYCDLPFRLVVRSLRGPSGGVGLACTDLLCPQAVLGENEKSLWLAATSPRDRPLCMQLYGADGDIMAQAALWAQDHGATTIDINMGCPVDKVTKKDGGSKLLTDLSRAVNVAKRVREELDRCPLSRDQWRERLGAAVLKDGLPERIPVPLTCKIRLCWSTSDYESGQACSPHLARMLADVGVVAVTVHGRTTEDKFQGTVRHAGIARVVESVDGQIPIIGNGDVREPEDAVAMIAKTGCSGVMIGRGALSTPWLFRDAWSLQTRGTIDPPPSDSVKIEIVRRYFNLMLEQREERYAMYQINRRISWFAKRLGFNPDGTRSGVKRIKEAIRNAKTPAEVHSILDGYQAGGYRCEMEVAEIGDE
jgi:nifR3 family TIM-barrel protein